MVSQITNQTSMEILREEAACIYLQCGGTKPHPMLKIVPNMATSSLLILQYDKIKTSNEATMSKYHATVIYLQ